MKQQSRSQRGSSYELYDRVSEKLMDVMGEQVSNVKQLTNLVWLVVAVINGQSIALSQLANLLPGEAEAESRVTRIREWLKNPRVDAWALYAALLKQVLQNWHGKTMSVMVDGTMVFGDRLQIFRLALAHGNRAIPLGWIVVSGKGLVRAERLTPLFERVAALLRTYASGVVLLADRGFRDHDWAELCRQVGWDYRIRITRNTHLRLRTGRTMRLDRLWLKHGRTLCLNQVTLTLSHAFVTNVSITWSRGDDKRAPELVIVVSNQAASPQRLCEYGVRMDIEQSFRDDKSAGFNIEHTRLQHPERLERLLLAVAIATLWCHELGEFVVQHGQAFRRLIDPADERQLSLFQLGLRWIQRCLAVMPDALPDLQARLSDLSLPPVRLVKT